MIFIDFQARPPPQLEHPPVSWCLPLQPSLEPAQQHGLTCHCVWCSQQVLAVGGFWVVNWEPGVHCNAKDTSSAKTQGPVPLFFPLICCLPSSLSPTPSCLTPAEIFKALAKGLQRKFLSASLLLPWQSLVRAQQAVLAVIVVFLLGELTCIPKVNMASEHIPLYVLGRFLLSELISSPIHCETLGYGETSKNCILYRSISEFLTCTACSPSSLCSCGI